ncbi:unnamed protein product, partial [Tuber aestivum]
MSVNRSHWRNVSFYDATNPDQALGGVVQNGSITEANFLDMLGILLVSDGSPLRVQERISSHIISRTDLPLETGVYDIYCDCMCYISLVYWAAQLLILSASVLVSNELWIRREVSHNVTGRDRTFCHRIRNRDRKCVISRMANPELGIKALDWSGYEAAHIFPLEHESHWVEYNYGRWITDMNDSTRSSK